MQIRMGKISELDLIPKESLLGNLKTEFKNRTQRLSLASNDIKSSIAWGILIFLLSRLSIMNGLMPFGLILFFALSSKKSVDIIIFLSIFIGAMITSDLTVIYNNMCTVVLFIILKRLFLKEDSSTDLLSILFIAISIIVPQTIYIIFRGFLLVDIVRAITLLVFTSCITQVFKSGLFDLIEKTEEKVKVIKCSNWREKELFEKKTAIFVQSLKQLSAAFANMSSIEVSQQDVYIILDRAAQRICGSCGMNDLCWGKNFYGTYRNLFEFVGAIEKKRIVEKKDLPEFFKNSCTKTNEFIAEVNNAYEIYKTDCFWQKKMSENRQLVSEQINWISDIIRVLPSEVSDGYDYLYNLEKNIKRGLSRYGIKHIIAYKDDRGIINVCVEANGCDRLKKCEKEIGSILSESISKKMVRKDKGCVCDTRTGKCKLEYSEQKRFAVMTGVSKRTKSEQKCSGDNYTFFENTDSRYILTLCDGMGSGKLAAEQSKNAIDIIEQLLKTGFERSIVFKFINSVLRARNINDTFTTIDLCMIDLYTGATDFYKIGAVPTFIKKEKQTEVIRSISLPAGILDNIELEFKKSNIEDGNFLITMSDGVYDAYEKNSVDLGEFIEDIETKNPQEMSDTIIKEAIKLCNGTLRDDMTVMVAKLWKR